MLCLTLLALLAAPDPAKEADIRKLMEITSATQLAAQIRDQMMESFKAAYPKVPAATWEELKKELKPDELINQLVVVYDKHFSQEDIKGLIAFYETPVGKRLLKELPAVTQESLELGTAYGRAAGQHFMQKLETKGYRLPGPK